MAATFHLQNPTYNEHNPQDYVLCINIPNILMSSKETRTVTVHFHTDCVPTCSKTQKTDLKDVQKDQIMIILTDIVIASHFSDQL